MRIVSVLLATCFMASPLGAVPTVPTQHTEAPRDAVARAFEFIGDLDRDRLLEKPYAERVLAELDIIRASDRYEGEVRDGVDLLRLIALGAADRGPEAMAFANELVARRATEPAIYSMAFAFAAVTDPQKAVDFLEQADKNLATPAGRAEFKDSLDEDTVWAVSRALAQAKDRAGRARLAEALLKLDWPGDAKPGHQDNERMAALKGRLAKGDVAGARTLARQIAAPATALELLIVKAYDPLVDAQDRGARITALIGGEDVRSARALSAKPDDLKLILDRAQFLRSVGRDREAIALLLPHTSDMAAVEKGGEVAFWLVNEAAYALSALGRQDEAIALMRRLTAIGFVKHPDLISMAINTAAIMNRAGRYREASAYAEELFRLHADKASKYGHMWMWEAAACSHAMAGNIAAARPWIARLRADADANRPALMLGLLCTNDLDGAAAQLIERLHGDKAGDMLVAVQDYSIVSTGSAIAPMLDQRLQQVVARPAVAAAIERKGRILKLPLSRTYWGRF